MAQEKYLSHEFVLPNYIIKKIRITKVEPFNEIKINTDLHG